MPKRTPTRHADAPQESTPGPQGAQDSLENTPDHRVARLAIDGGPAVFPQGPPTWPPRDDAVFAALRAAYQNGDWGRYQGENGAQLIAVLSRMHAVPHVMVCCSGTFAVELALRALRVGRGAEVILAGYDFPGNFRAIEAVGARPILVDIEPGTWCLDMDQVATAIGPKTKAIIASHLHGGLTDMARLCELAEGRSVAVVEDACQAPGAVIQGRRAGTWGQLGVLSFGGSKLLTAGRGGAILTRDSRIMQRAKVVCERGNEAFPLSELQAAVLIPQLSELDARNHQRQRSAQRLTAALDGQSALRPVSCHTDRGRPSFYKLALRYQSHNCAGRPRDEIVRALQAEGLAVGEGFRGFVRRGKARCDRLGKLPFCRQAASETVLLHHPVLLQSAETIDRVADAIAKVAHHFAAQR